MTKPNGHRDSKWLPTTGPDYIWIFASIQTFAPYCPLFELHIPHLNGNEFEYPEELIAQWLKND